MDRHRDENSAPNGIHDDSDVNENDVEMSKHETSIRVQKSYKDLIRKLENKELFGMSQARFSSGITDSNNSQISINENNAMKELMDEAHDLYKNVQGPHEARLDARVLKHVSRICRLRSQELSVNQQQFKPFEFADKLIQAMGGNVSNECETDEIPPLSTNGWGKLGYKVQSIVNTTPYLHYMLGSIREEHLRPENNSQELKSSQIVQKTRRANNRNDERRPTTEAKVLDFNDKNSANNTAESRTDVLVESTYSQLVKAYLSANKEPICYFSFVLDPTNFGATVENMFYSSFLIKEGKAKIYFKKMDENDQHLPYIIPLNKRKVKEGTGNDLDNKKQLLTSISYEEWIRLKETFKRSTSMINHQ